METDELDPEAGIDEAETLEGEPNDESADLVERRSEEPERRVARLRRLAVNLDSRPALLTAAGRLRRSLPGDERFGDALSTAGTQPVEVVARGVSAMQPKRKSVVQELGLAGLQVWQSLSEATGRGHGDREMAIMFTDLVAFSNWALKSGDTAALQLLREVGGAVEEPVLRHDGRIVKRLGDGLMATFLEPRSAIEAALEAQEAVCEIDLDGYTPRLRAGIHWGSPRKLGGDYLGVDVNVAARIVEAAKADHVLVSEAVTSRIDMAGLKAGRWKRLKADGAPRGLQVAPIGRE